MRPDTAQLPLNSGRWYWRLIDHPGKFHHWQGPFDDEMYAWCKALSQLVDDLKNEITDLRYPSPEGETPK